MDKIFQLNYASLNVKLNWLLCEFTLFKYKLMKLISAKAACSQRTFQVLRIFFLFQCCIRFSGQSFQSQNRKGDLSSIFSFIQSLHHWTLHTYKCFQLTKQTLNAITKLKLLYNLHSNCIIQNVQVLNRTPHSVIILNIIPTKYDLVTSPAKMAVEERAILLQKSSLN